MCIACSFGKEVFITNQPQESSVNSFDETSTFIALYEAVTSLGVNTWNGYYELIKTCLNDELDLKLSEKRLNEFAISIMLAFVAVGVGFAIDVKYGEIGLVRDPLEQELVSIYISEY